VRAGTEFGGLDLASCTDRSKALAVARVPDHRPPTAGSHGEPAVAADDGDPERTAVEELRPWLPPGREGDGAAVLSAGHTESGPAELDAHHAARSDVENGTTARLDERLAQRRLDSARLHRHLRRGQCELQRLAGVDVQQ